MAMEVNARAGYTGISFNHIWWAPNSGRIT